MPNNSPLFIVLNGPPESGKTTVVARGLMNRFETGSLKAVRDSFAAPMKHFIASSLGVKYNDLKKDTMMGVLKGYSPREFLINLGEFYMKERYGDDIFGRFLQHRILRIDPLPNVVVVDDGGFDEEVGVLGNWTLPRANVRIVRVERPGKSFEGDSRNYLEEPNYRFYNDGTLEEIEPKLDHLAHWIVEQLGH